MGKLAYAHVILPTNRWDSRMVGPWPICDVSQPTYVYCTVSVYYAF